MDLLEVIEKKIGRALRNQLTELGLIMLVMNAPPLWCKSNTNPFYVINDLNIEYYNP